MTTLLIVCVFMGWSVFGVVWAIYWDIMPIDVPEYNAITIFLGGPCWWLAFLLGIILVKRDIFRFIKPMKKKV